MNLPVQPQPQLDHIHAQTIIDFDYCTICIFIGGYFWSINAHTRNSAKQSISPHSYCSCNHRGNTWSILRCRVYHSGTSTWSSSCCSHHFCYISYNTKFGCIQFNKKHQHDFYSACIYNLRISSSLSSRRGYGCWPFGTRGGSCGRRFTYGDDWIFWYWRFLEPKVSY